MYSGFFLFAGCGEHLVRTFLAKECGEALAGTRYWNFSPKIILNIYCCFTLLQKILRQYRSFLWKALRHFFFQATAPGATTSDEGAVCWIRVPSRGSWKVGRGHLYAGDPGWCVLNLILEIILSFQFEDDVCWSLKSYFPFQFDKEGGTGEFLWTHTTASMGIGEFDSWFNLYKCSYQLCFISGFQSTHEEDATVKMSRLPPSAQQGTTILVEAVPFPTNNLSQ